MPSDLAKLNTLENNLVDTRARCLRRGLRVRALDDALAGVRRAKAAIGGRGTDILRKRTAAEHPWSLIDQAESRRIEREARDRAAWEKRGPGLDLGGGDMRKSAAAEASALDMLKTYLKTAKPVRPAWAFGCEAP